MTAQHDFEQRSYAESEKRYPVPEQKAHHAPPDQRDIDLASDLRTAFEYGAEWGRADALVEKAAWQAEALEAMADEGEAFMFGAGYEKPADDEWDVAPRWHEIRRLRERAKSIREGQQP